MLSRSQCRIVRRTGMLVFSLCIALKGSCVSSEALLRVGKVTTFCAKQYFFDKEISPKDKFSCKSFNIIIFICIFAR